MLISDDDVEVIEHTEYEVDLDTPRHDVVIKRSSKNGKIRIENVPPSEFLISRESKDIQDARFVCHRVIKTLSELREMYPDEDLDPGDLGGGGDDMSAFSAERLERYQFDKSAKYWEGMGGGDDYGEEGLRTYWLHESLFEDRF